MNSWDYTEFLFFWQKVGKVLNWVLANLMKLGNLVVRS